MPGNPSTSFPTFPGFPAFPFAPVSAFTPFAPFAPFASLASFNPLAQLPQFATLDQDVVKSWYKFVGLNTDFTKSMTEEAQFDWASWFVPQDPEEMVARQWTSQMPFLSIPLHYATSMMELGAATQRAWMDAWGRMLNVPGLAAEAGEAVGEAADAITDVPASSIRETPKPRKDRAH
ncbi:polyhydroxyalkanoate granule-associated phasin [Cupriavidus agavae]|uniref:Phasin domain-containing protein n=1 Tax=Cupriavidus agavae TaxID=1001822 RepID=A0A4Q7RCB6_9BURK|nr:polyhydroxyalkanoate granule-associated phasin [Cupriavidus agavae]RZT30805.1 hypothetical protein EV147_4653 [Cupriavidus agavae]